MSYHKDRWQGAGAIAAAAPAPRSAPAPMVGRRALGAIADLTSLGSKCTVVDANGVCIQGPNTRAPQTRVLGGGAIQPQAITPPTANIGVLSQLSPTLSFGTTTPTIGIGSGTLRPLNPTIDSGGSGTIGLGTGGLKVPTTTTTTTSPPASTPTSTTTTKAPASSSIIVAAPTVYKPPQFPSSGGGGGIVKPPASAPIDASVLDQLGPSGMSRNTKIAIGVGAVAIAVYLYRRRRASRKP